MSLLLLFSRAPGPVFMEATVAGVSSTTALLGLGLPLVATVAGESAFPLTRLYNLGPFELFQVKTVANASSDDPSLTLDQVPGLSHFLMAFVSVAGGNNRTVTPPMGGLSWEPLSDSNNGTSVGTEFFIALSDGATTSFEFSIDAPCANALTILDFGGVDLFLWGSQLSIFEHTGSGTSQPVPFAPVAVNTWFAKDRLPVICWASVANTSYTPDAAMIEVADAGQAGLTQHIAIDTSSLMSDEATTRTAVAANAGAWVSIGMALFARRYMLLAMARREVNTYTSQEVAPRNDYSIDPPAMTTRWTVNAIAFEGTDAAISAVVEVRLTTGGPFMESGVISPLTEAGQGQVVVPVSPYGMRIRATVSGGTDAFVTFDGYIELIKAVTE